MAERVVDLTDLEQFEAVESGVYPVKIIDVAGGEGEKGEYDTLTLEITAGEYEGRKLFSNISYSPKARWKIQEFLKALGREYEGSLSFDTDELIGEELRVRVKKQDPQEEGDDPRSVVKKFLTVA